jgi:hypothetical protein
MKFDQYGCLVREAPREPGHEIANLGDSASDTCRLYIVGHDWMAYPLDPFQLFSGYANYGFVRHRDLVRVEGWDHKDFTNDQLVPLMMAQFDFGYIRKDHVLDGVYIRGTKKLAQPAVYAILYRQWWLLNLMNHIQGWLLGLPFRWSDDKSEGAGLRSSKGKVQDYPTMIATTVFLNRVGYKARLPRPAKECIEALEAYRFNPKDFEPNAEWEIDIYRKAINDLKTKGLAK